MGNSGLQKLKSGEPVPSESILLYDESPGESCDWSLSLKLLLVSGDLPKRLVVSEVALKSEGAVDEEEMSLLSSLSS